MCVLQKCSGNAKAAAWSVGWCVSIIQSTWNCGGNKQGGLFFDKLILDIRLQLLKSYAHFLFPFQAIESYLSQLRWCLNIEHLRKWPLNRLAAVFKAALWIVINWVCITPEEDVTWWWMGGQMNWPIQTLPISKLETCLKGKTLSHKPWLLHIEVDVLFLFFSPLVALGQLYETIKNQVTLRSAMEKF